MTDIEEYEEEDYESDLKKELLARMKNPKQLKPCPFCGGEVEINSYGGTLHYFIMCKSCWLKIEDGFAPTRMPKEALIGFYNRRVNE